MVTVVFPAAGQGSRMNLGMNKVFLELAGKPMLIRTLMKFSECPCVDKLVVVVAQDEFALVDHVLRAVPHLKPYVVTVGGSERQYSIYNGLGVMDPDTDIVLVHDAARPFVSIETVEKVIAAAREYGAAVAAVPEKNTIKVVNQDGIVKLTPDRAQLWEVQTPQGFRKEILLEAYEKANHDGFLGTDDASLVERLGRPVKIVNSDYRNIKITTPEDLLIVEAFMRDGRLHQAKESLKNVFSSAASDLKENLFRPK